MAFRLRRVEFGISALPRGKSGFWPVTPEPNFGRLANLRVLVAKSGTDVSRSLSHDLNGVKQREGSQLRTLRAITVLSIASNTKSTK
jgi:hypothetical protein